MIQLHIGLFDAHERAFALNALDISRLRKLGHGLTRGNTADLKKRANLLFRRYSFPFVQLFFSISPR